MEPHLVTQLAEQQLFSCDLLITPNHCVCVCVYVFDHVF